MLLLCCCGDDDDATSRENHKQRFVSAAHTKYAINVKRRPRKILHRNYPLQNLSNKI